VHKGGLGVLLPGTLDEVREVDLAGTTIRSVTAAQVTAAVAASPTLSAALKGTQLSSLHHDLLSQPNGHMVLMFSATQSFQDLPGYPGTTAVLGDVLVDVDRNFNPDWVWNSFDHLDVNRHPFMFPDWTHSNALLYTSEDGDLLLSIRHQNWIVKIDFQDGKGTGNVVWRLGKDGDFKLLGGTDPTDWFSAQHAPSFFSPNNTGIFSLGLMDNGDHRAFPSGENCSTSGSPPSSTLCYSTASVLLVNESLHTATLTEHYLASGPGGPVYSYFGGDISLLDNGDREVNFSAAKGGSIVQDLRGSTGSEQVVWQAVTAGTYQYRAQRLPSLYPGVQW
jgi:arylsulfate sulfotransferase